MEELIFEVQGSAEKPYRVSFIKHSIDKLSAYCTCPAGENGQYCKHRFRIMVGKKNDIVSKNESDVPIIQKWIIGTNIENLLFKVCEKEDEKAQEEAKKTKNELSLAKKILTKAMYD